MGTVERQLRCNTPEERPSSVQRWSRCLGDIGGPTFMFTFLIATNSMVNFDAGGTAAVLVLLSKGCVEKSDREYGDPPKVQPYDANYPCMDQDFKGYLGAAVYIGLCFGCPLLGILFKKFNVKAVLVVFLFLTSAATLVFATTIDKTWLLLSKFSIGFTHGCISLYGPIWVAGFAPAANKTLWYGLMQSAAAIGNVVGYAVCGYLTSSGLFYQFGFRCQAVYLIASTLVLCCLPSYRVEAPARQDELAVEGALSSSFIGSCLSSSHLSAPPVLHCPPSVTHLPPVDESPLAREDQAEAGERVTPRLTPTPSGLLRNPMFVTTVFSLSGLYFVVTATQYWVSEYFVKVFDREVAEVTTAFFVVSATAPILGVVIGSSTADRLGGITGADQVAKICGLNCLFGLLALMGGLIAVFAAPDSSSHSSGPLHFYIACAGIWVQLFFGGAILPSLTGISLESVKLADRTVASSLSMLFCNLFGFSLGVFVPGALSQRYDMRVAMQVVFCWPGFVCVGMMSSLCVAHQGNRR